MTAAAPRPSVSGWVGWVGFAGVILILNGAFSLVQGIAALVGSNTYYVLTEGGLLLFDVTGWGWWNLLIGAALVLTGIALFMGASWARIVAIVLAGLSAIGQLMLLPAQPWWAVIVIAVDVLVIYAITAHGKEMTKN
ncbi:DUF7144 family membrane protein [Agromyces seonyuensis]|uniref:DUF7144 domain-containing protein n=1 Tax=Agromyces seonyuensis TaxID=2662446 RepID=A0A6I4P848_9MICO|nr:hypothetical protein [Agromyces seonyuensis]MWC00155.1 hypothetical protein [Agromyces seonyuensis]